MKAIIFDLGRVLVDYEHAHTLSGLAAICQLPVDKIRQLTSGETAEKMGVGHLSARKFHAYLTTHAGVQTDFDLFINAYAAGIVRNEMALTYARLLCLRADCRVGVVSNTNEAHVLWLRRQLPELGEFHTVIMSSEVGLVKPDPAIYRLALERLEASPEQSIFIDDLPENVQGARAVGMAGIVHENWRKTTALLEKWLVTPL